MSKKVCLVTCYRDTEYVRGKTLHQALLSDKKIDLVVIKNRHKGLLRYPEVILQLIKTRLRHNPDVYLITFRGYEILPFVLMIAAGKKVIFDEFINMVEWLVDEHKKVRKGSLGEKVIVAVYRFFLVRSTAILSDTPSHAAYSAKRMRINPEKYTAIPVGADEAVFKPFGKPAGSNSSLFRVFYYGSMLPLHGVQYVIEAAEKLTEYKDIELLLVGGASDVETRVRYAQSAGANIVYKKWIDYHDLPGVINESSLCLGGPFGNTVQSQFVVTGKTCQFLAMEKPVIVGSTKESGVLKNKQNVLVVQQGSADELKNAIEWAYHNQGKLAAIGSNGRMAYEQYYSHKTVRDRLLALLQDI